jgi:hypothetical protein
MRTTGIQAAVFSFFPHQIANLFHPVHPTAKRIWVDWLTPLVKMEVRL